MSDDWRDKPIREASSVILVRPRSGSGEGEVFMLRRHRKSSFMSSAYVFPGGAAEAGDTDPRHTAARELFEEAGVLLATSEVSADQLQSWRDAINDDDHEAELDSVLAAAGVSLDLDALHYFSHWITPSVERKRFSARFYVAALPAGQTPSFDNKETVDEVWVTPGEALARSKELKLPPPQVRTFIDLQQACAAGLDAVFAECARRAEHPYPIMPRLCPDSGGGFCLLLPWDPDYETRGSGDLQTMPADHPLAEGNSRFILEDMTWKNVAADSASAD